MKISEEQSGMSETYVVKYWYKDSSGYHKQSEDDFYSNSKSAHEQIAKYAKRHLSKYHEQVEIISVIYC